MRHCRGFSLGLSFCELVPGGILWGVLGCSVGAAIMLQIGLPVPPSNHPITSLTSVAGPFLGMRMFSGGIEVSPSTDIFNNSQMITQYSSLDL